MNTITDKSTKHQIIENIIESGLQSLSKSVLMKNYNKAELLELMTQLNEKRKTVASQAKQDALSGKQVNILDLIDNEVIDASDMNPNIRSSEIVSREDESQAEDILEAMNDVEQSISKKRKRPLNSKKAETGAKVVKATGLHRINKVVKATGLHRINKDVKAPMKGVRGTLRASVTKAENNNEPVTITFYLGDVQKPTLSLPITIEIQSLDSIDSSGEEVKVNRAVYTIEGVEHVQKPAYQAVREFFSIQ